MTCSNTRAADEFGGKSFSVPMRASVNAPCHSRCRSHDMHRFFGLLVFLCGGHDEGSRSLVRFASGGMRRRLRADKYRDIPVVFLGKSALGAIGHRSPRDRPAMAAIEDSRQ